MINVFGPFLLVLFFNTSNSGEGGAVQMLPTQADCEAVLTQLEPVRWVTGVCVAATVKKADQ